MKTLVLSALFYFVLAGAAIAQTPVRPDTAKTIGQRVPDVELIDENGVPFRLSSLAGKPVIVSPIFTTCSQTCSTITSSLRDAVTAIGAPGKRYHVVTFSFDATDTAGDLKAYRKKNGASRRLDARDRRR